MPYRRTFLHTSTHKNASTYRHFHSSDSKKIEMTEGPLFGKILRFVFPLMLTNLLQVFYNAADMVTVSFSKEPDAVGAIGMTGAFVNLILNILLGAATGANVVIARHLGAKDDDKTSRAVHTAMFLSVILGFVALAFGVIASKPIIRLMGADGNLLTLATRYTLIYFLGAPFISVTNYFIAIFRAKGDTKTPLAILSFSGLCNVVLNLIFVFCFDLSVEGVAIATSIANLLSSILLCKSLSKDTTACRFSFKKLRIDSAELKEILRLGIPAGIQGSLFSISNILVQTSVLQLNNMLTPIGSTFAPVVKGNAVVSNLEGFIYTAQNTVYQAAISFTSQNVGAKKHERVYKIMKNCYLIGFIIALVFSLIIFVFHSPLLSFYGVKNGVIGTLDAIAFETAIIKIKYMVLPYFFVSIMEVGCGVVRGLGKSVSSTIISLFGACGLRILWIYTVFKIWPTREVLYISYPVSWGITAIIFLIYITIILKKTIKQRDTV